MASGFSWAALPQQLPPKYIPDLHEDPCSSTSVQYVNLTNEKISYLFPFPAMQLTLFPFSIISSQHFCRIFFFSLFIGLCLVIKMDRKKIIIVILIISAGATLCRPYQISFLFIFLNLLGTIVPPLPGIILADYFIIHHGSYARLESVKFHNFNIIPWIAWVLSLVLVFTLPFGLPSLNGLILGAVIYTVLMKITKNRLSRRINSWKN